MKLDVEGQVGATQYCDNNGSNCFTPSNAALWTLADTNEITSSAGNDVDIEWNAAIGSNAGNPDTAVALRIWDNDFAGNTNRAVYQSFFSQTIPTTTMTA